MDKLMRKYTDPKQVRVGDVVMLDNDTLSPFATSIVSGIENLDGKYPLIFLGRVHARCGSHRITGHHRAEQIAVMIEDYPVEADRFVEIYSVFVNGPKGQIDNRNGIYTSEMVAETNKAGESVEDRAADQKLDEYLDLPSGCEG